jgi:hypothetical protein
LISASVEAIVGLLKIENGWILIQFAFATSASAQKKWLPNGVNATARNVKRTALAVYIEGEQGRSHGQLLAASSAPEMTTPGKPGVGIPECYCAIAAGRYFLGWLMGLEPTTTRITIWDSTS